MMIVDHLLEEIPDETMINTRPVIQTDAEAHYHQEMKKAETPEIPEIQEEVKILHQDTFQVINLKVVVDGIQKQTKKGLNHLKNLKKT